MGRYSRHVAEEDLGDIQFDGVFQEDTPHVGEDPFVSTEPVDVARSHAQPISNALAKRQTARAWDMFNQTYTSKDCEALTAPSVDDAKLLDKGKIFSDLLQSVNAGFCSGRHDITPTMILFKFEQLGLARPEYWSRTTLAYLTHQTIEAVNGSSGRPQRDLPALLTELLSVWRLFFQCKGKQGDPLEEIKAEWQLPTFELSVMFESNDFNMRLQECHPGFVGNSTIGFCAVYLYTISDALAAMQTLQHEAAPFLQLVERLLAGARVSSILQHTTRSNAFQILSAEVQAQIRKEIGDAPGRAMAMIGTQGGTEDLGDAAANLEASFLKRITRATESKTSTEVLDRLWKQVEKQYTSKQNTVAIPPRIYNAFLSGYLKLFHSPRTVAIWNHMIAHGVNPDNQSWVALLDGCVKAKDLTGFNGTWARMLNSGAEPDNHIWTTRVSGLIFLRQINSGFAALDEMGKRWLVAENAAQPLAMASKKHKGAKPLVATKSVNKCTKPSTETLNGAISAIVRTSSGALRYEKRIEFVQKLLGWAGKFQIAPDARTYNSLMQLYLHAGDYSTAFKVLRQMEADGIQGDVATHTMLIRAAFDNDVFDKLTPSEQGERVISMLKDLETSGSKLDDRVCGVAIDALLKKYSNFDAVRAIIDHMHSRNLIASAQIYTSLASHYFQQDPPAIAAVDSITHQIFTSDRIPNDRYLFDRLIEGYAHHGEIGTMMSVLTRMSKHGKLPGYRALTAVVQALMKDGDAERAQAIVRDVERGEGIAQNGVLGGSQYENVFFAAVRGFGLDAEAAPISQDSSAQGDAPAEVQGDLESSNPPQMGAAFARESTVQKDEEDVHGFLTDEPEPRLAHGQ